MSAPDWLVPGAEVIVYSSGPLGEPRARRDTVAKVGARDLRLVDTAEKFSTARLERTLGSGRFSSSERVASAQDPAAMARLAECERETAVSAAESILHGYRRERRKDRDPMVLIEARDALTRALAAQAALTAVQSTDDD